MSLAILNTTFWALDARFLQRVEPHVRNAIQNGTPIALPYELRIKPVQADLADADGRMIPFVAAGAIEAAEGQSRANASSTKNVSVIPLQGVMAKNGDLCSHGTKDIVAWIGQANADPNIDAIVLYTDSPGGAVDGTEDLAQAISSSNKPIVGFIDGQAASAAMWAISQTKEIYINQKTTAFAGSIGVLATVIDQSKALEQAGISIQIVRDPEAVDKALLNGVEPVSSETITALQSDLKTIKSTFKAAIQTGRGDKISSSENVFTGKMYNGQDAIKYGLVDKVGTLQDAVNAAAKYAAKSSSTQNKDKKMKLNASVAPLLATAMGVESTATEAEITEAHLVAAEQAFASHGTALEAIQTQLTTAQASEQTAVANFNAQTAELETLRAWKASAAVLPDAKKDASEEGEIKPKKLSKIDSEAKAKLESMNKKA